MAVVLVLFPFPFQLFPLSRSLHSITLIRCFPLSPNWPFHPIFLILLSKFSSLPMIRLLFFSTIFAPLILLSVLDQISENGMVEAGCCCCCKSVLGVLGHFPKTIIMGASQKSIKTQKTNNWDISQKSIIIGTSQKSIKTQIRNTSRIT